MAQDIDPNATQGIDLSDDEEQKLAPLDEGDDPFRITHIDLDKELHLQRPDTRELTTQHAGGSIVNDWMTSG